MRLLIATVVSLLAAPALAYDLRNLSSQDVLLIGEALDAMPHGKVAGLYARIQQQLTVEDQATAADARTKIEEEVKAKVKSEMAPTPAPKKDNSNE